MSGYNPKVKGKKNRNARKEAKIVKKREHHPLSVLESAKELNKDYRTIKQKIESKGKLTKDEENRWNFYKNQVPQLVEEGIIELQREARKKKKPFELFKFWKK